VSSYVPFTTTRHGPPSSLLSVFLASVLENHRAADLLPGPLKLPPTQRQLLVPRQLGASVSSPSTGATSFHHVATQSTLPGQFTSPLCSYR
jgi:hypothetical protein